MGGGDEPTEQSGETPSESGEPAGGSETDAGSPEETEPADADAEPLAARISRDVTKRQLLAGAGVLLVVLLLLVVVLVPSSLLGLVYSSTAEFEAAQAAGSESALETHEYDLVEHDEFVVEEDISMAGQTRTVATLNHLHSYERTLTVQGGEFDAAIFTVVSTPAVEVATRPFNPLAELSHAELLTEFGDDLEGGYDGLDDLEPVDEHEGVLLGQQTTISQFRMTVEDGGEDVDVYLYVAAVQSGDDIVVAVGGHPAPFAQERFAILELMATAEHPAR